MKKLIMILSAFMLTATTASTIIACGKTKGTTGEQSNSSPNPKDLTSQQDVDDAIEELKELDLIVSIFDDEKTKDQVIESIENSTEIGAILTKYKVKIIWRNLTLKSSDGSALKGSDIKDDLVFKVLGQVTVGGITEAFEISKAKLQVKRSTDSQEAYKAKKDLEDLNLTVSILDDEKTKDQVIESIKNSTKIGAILTRYNAKIDWRNLTLELSDGSALKDSNIKDNLVFKVSGQVTVGKITEAFEISKAKLQEERSTDGKKADDAKKYLENLNLTVSILDDEKTINQIIKSIKNSTEIGAILTKYNAKIDWRNLTLELSDGSALEGSDIKNDLVFKVSGQVTVGKITEAFEISKAKLQEKRSTDSQDVDKAKKELEDLNLTVSIFDDEKTINQVIESIEDSKQIETILTNHNARIDWRNLTLKSSDGSTLKGSNIKNNLAFKVLGQVTVGKITEAFEISKAKLQEERSTDGKKADDAKKDLENLNLTVSIFDDEKTKDQVIGSIENSTKIKEILTKYNAKIKWRNLTLKSSDGSTLKESGIKNGLVFGISGKVKVGTKAAEFNLTKVNLEVTNADEVKANDVAKDVNLLYDMTVEIADNRKNKNEIIKQIKNAVKDKEIKNKVVIDIISVKLSDDSDLKDSDIKDDLVLKVLGKVKVGTKAAEFNLTEVNLKVTHADKIKANDAVDNLLWLFNSKPDSICIKPSDLITVKKNDGLNAILLKSDYIKGDVKLVDGKFTSKVNTGWNKVSGKIEVNGQISDKELNFIIILRDKDEDFEAFKLNDLSDIALKSSVLGTTNKTKTLNDELLKHKYIKDIIKDDVELEDGKFTFKVAGADSDDTNLVNKAIVIVSGKIKGQTSPFKPRFTVRLEENDANIAVIKLNGLKKKLILFNASQLGTTNKTKTLNDELLKHKYIKDIIKDDVKLVDEKFTIEVACADADDNNLVNQTIVTVSGKIKVKGQISDEKFEFTTYLLA